MRNIGAVVTVAAASVLAVSVPFIAATASASTLATRAVQVTPPSNAMPGGAAELFAVDCVRAQSCVAGGDYVDASGDLQAMAIGSAGGTWAPAHEIAMPSTANPNPSAYVRSVSCIKIGSCVAVGNYSSATLLGFVAAQSHGSWRQAQRLKLPANMVKPPISQAASVWCTSPGSCVAVGNYETKSGDIEGVVATESGGKWVQARELRMPANAAANPSATLTAVTCVRTGQCVATAQYTTTSDAIEAALVTESGGTWRQAAEVKLQRGAPASPDAGLESVTCTAPGQCIAVGQFTDHHANLLSFAVIESAGTWGRGHQVGLAPGNAAAHPQVSLTSVACEAAGSCTAAGSYLDKAGGTAPLALTRAKGKWTAAAEIKPPVSAQQGGTMNAAMVSVSCTSAGYCAAVGYYLAQNGHFEAMAARIS